MLRWLDQSHTMIGEVDGNHTVVIDITHPRWEVTHQRPDIESFTAYQARCLVAVRAKMIASRRQVRLALGEAGCAAMDAAADDPALPWAMREQIRSSHEWHRTAPEIDEFAWLLGLGPDAVDALFAKAISL